MRGSASARVEVIVVLLRPSGAGSPKVASARDKLFSPVHASVLEGVAAASRPSSWLRGSSSAAAESSTTSLLSCGR
ncbi:hypothetical protein ACFQ3Z_01465 [Streptomyces nogalater]